MWLSWPVRHPWWTVALVAVACGGAVAAVLRLRPDASLEGLFPRDSASGQAVVRVLNDFPVTEELLLLVSTPEAAPADPGRLVSFASRLDAAVRRDPELSKMAADVVYRPDPHAQQFFERVVAPAGLFYLDDAALEQARARLTPAGIREQLKRNQDALSAPGPAAGALTKVLLKDPLRLHEFLLERF